MVSDSRYGRTPQGHDYESPAWQIAWTPIHSRSIHQSGMARTKIARAGVGDRVRVGIGDAEQLHFNGQYDVIWMVESSEHFEDKAGFIHKTAQLIREHGKFVIAAWTAADAHPLVKELARLTVCPGFQTAEDYARQ